MKSLKYYPEDITKTTYIKKGSTH